MDDRVLEHAADAQMIERKVIEDRRVEARLPAHIAPRATIGGVPVHAMLVPFPIACFTGAMLSDWAYAQSANIQWANFSAWLLAFGMVMGSLAALFGLIDLIFTKARPRPAIAVWHMLGNFVMLALALVNNLVHARDGWTAVVPTGLTLSVLTVLIMVVTGFMGHRMAYARRAGALA